MADRISELRAAKTFLAEAYPEAFTPERVVETLGLKQKGATLARKFRDAVRAGELVVAYYRNERNEEIATYAYNPAYHQTERRTSRADFLVDQAKEEGTLTASSPEVHTAAQIHGEMMK